MDIGNISSCSIILQNFLLVSICPSLYFHPAYHILILANPYQEMLDIKYYEVSIKYQSWVLSFLVNN